MTRGVLVLAAVIGLGVVGMAAARHDEDGESVKPLAALDIAEKLDGKETTASAVEVTIEPGKAGLQHRHPGPGFGYVLEGEYEWAIGDQPAKVLKAGRMPASGVQEPGQGQDPAAGVGPASEGRQGHRRAGDEVIPLA